MNEEDNKKEENVKETKIDILKSILSEVSIFKNKITSLESSLYKKEQTDEAAAAEAFLETESDKEAIKVDKEGLPTEEPEKEEEGGFFSFLSGAIGFIAILTPIILKNLDVIKDVFKGLPDLFGSSLKEIMFSVFEKIQTALTKSVYEPIQKYLTDTVGQLWRSLVLSVEETFVGVIGSLPTFLKDNLPDVIKGLTESAAEDIANGGKPGKEPEVELKVGSSGSFGATENAQFGGEYKPQEYGTPVAPPASKPSAKPATETKAAGAPTTPSAPTVSESEAVPVSMPPAATTTAVAEPSSAPSVMSGMPSGDGMRIESTPAKADAISAKPQKSQSADENLGLVESALKNLGMDDPKYIKAVKANVLKESQGKPISENLNYGKTSNERIRKIFGSRAAKYTDEQLDVIKKDPVQMAELMYGAGTELGKSMGNTEAGDGYKYRGRGFIQLTFKSNYAAASKDLFKDDRLVQNPDLVNDPTIAALVVAWYMKKGKSSMAKKLGIDESNMTQEEANLLATSQIAGGDVRKKGAYGQELLAKVESYSGELGTTSEAPAQLASIVPTPPTASSGTDIVKSSQEMKTVAEKQEEEQQQVIIQTVAQSQTPQVVPDRKPASSKKPAPPADLIQRSYASYFAVA